MQSVKKNDVVWRLLALIILLLAALFWYGCNHIVADASDINMDETGKFMIISQSAKAYSQKSESSDVVVLFSSGDTVFIVNEENDWIQILYHGENAYIKNVGEGLFAEADNSEAAKEMEKQEQIDKAWIESYYEQMRAIRVSKVWKGVIIVVIVLAVGYLVFKSVHQQGDKGNKESTK
ncbi:hypothetical protein SAMN04487928_108104 [Butyrivibrio proteoclasticus]|uniref:SH3b domain-containing protein n=1 Tax=Butyrivibrio proteoclasticus TaxID=43305 RepID=A0A1I5TBS9_9FIRM|nr:hypothetical protein [Butyrivibrio proteoclasticus]SFP80117.1 hypothetical protein SAMN04487928_108104 [Butyrivibrio proteoclasticus]